ncbi:hypothetical protein JHS3_07170 [Jeongeupia sp. HS-3]|uniref:hypothetical protein n=1 Tax=Jeongeupia sp. HS-3 TaxID=1009682 RepID=UPI0018A57ABD|nr:hypothetical protein [Jeongeupia sp. HS-3]BCL74981.1 hypothetical protein JHS3_07170 [Jeongeupia sp. HS-3]
MPAEIRNPCPPGACVCGRDALLDDPFADCRVLLLTRDDERKLVERIARARDYADLQQVCARIEAQLGVVLRIRPGPNEVRTALGFEIAFDPHPGLCRKTQQAIPAAVRRCLNDRPAIAYEILDAHSLFAPANTRWCRHKMHAQIAMQRIWTAARNDAAFLA